MRYNGNDTETLRKTYTVKSNTPDKATYIIEKGDNYLIAGDVNTAQNGSDYFLMEIDKYGTALDTIIFGDSMDNYMHSIYTYGDDVFISGYTIQNNVINISVGKLITDDTYHKKQLSDNVNLGSEEISSSPIHNCGLLLSGFTMEKNVHLENTELYW